MPADGKERSISSREFGKNAGVALAALALGLGLSEAGLRLFFPQPLAERYGSPAGGGPLVTTDEELGWALRPKVSGVSSDEPWQADLATNALGFRDVEHGEKTTGVTRVAVLGDSFVFGSGVRQDEPVTRRLAALLGPSFEVINLGVPGYGTDQALLTLRKWGRRLSPDLVLAGFFWNDVMENASAEMYGMNKPRFVLAGESLSLVPPGEARNHSAFARLDAVLGARSHFWSLVRGSFGKTAERVEPEARPVMVDLSLRAAPPAREPEFALTWALLGAFESEARALGATPILFTVPPRFLVDDVAKKKILKIYSLAPDALDEDGFFRVKDACLRRDLPVVDLLPAFRDAAKAGERLFLPSGIHWSAKGHALAALVIEPAVRDAARVPRKK
ncbi:MAG TPA: SGNH/GDSL hydrolase family protein [Thermoanaerobaculia bacterium]|nr:SGNH/GDSL hydrolase family protein [Thermoanaerobaculia bacterium]